MGKKGIDWDKGLVAGEPGDACRCLAASPQEQAHARALIVSPIIHRWKECDEAGNHASF